MEYLQTATPIYIAKHMVIPINRLCIQTRACGGFCIRGLVEPHAIVYSTSQGWRSIDVKGNEIRLQTLLQEVSDLRECLQNIELNPA